MRRGDVKILSLFDTYYTQVERARNQNYVVSRIPRSRAFPQQCIGRDGQHDREKKKRRTDLVNFARAIAMGTAYCIAHPREAIKISYEMYPRLKPSDGNIEEAIHEGRGDPHDDRIESWRLDNPRREQWGSVDVGAFQSYFDWLRKNDLLKGKVDAAQVTTNDLIADINKFDKKLVEAE